MVQYPFKVRVNTVQRLDYTFKDSHKAVIDLTSYVSVSLEVKQQGQVFSTTTAAFVSKPAGTVRLTPFIFTQVGVWDVQFFCVDGSSKKLFGEPLQVRVVKNVEDLTTSELLNY